MTERIPIYGQHTEAAARLARVFEAADCLTRPELAAVLRIRQASIAEAERRGVIPSDWLIKLLYLRGVNPAWVLDGIGPKFLVPEDDSEDADAPPEGFSPERAADAVIMRRVLRCFSAGDLADELRRRGGEDVPVSVYCSYLSKM